MITLPFLKVITKGSNPYGERRETRSLIPDRFPDHSGAIGNQTHFLTEAPWSATETKSHPVCETVESKHEACYAVVTFTTFVIALNPTKIHSSD